MGVKPGYKQTEVGVVPEDWNVRSLEEITDPKRPICYGIVQVGPFRRNGIPVLAIKNLNVDYFTSVHRSGLEIEAPYVRSRVRSGDVLISVKGTTGRVGIVPENFEGNISRDLARLRLSDENVPEFWSQVLQGDAAQKRLGVATVGTTRMELSIGVLKQVRMPCPPKDDQRAIAAALGDVDALIGALDQLIAKKRDLKQAAMQQLLTGQRRLPGFHGEWMVKRLGEILRVRHGKSQAGVVAADGLYPILATGGEIGRTNTYLWDKPSVLIGRKGTIDVPQYVESPFWTIDTLFFTEIFETTVPKFIFFKFKMVNWRSYNEASGVPSLNASTIEDIELSCPTRIEQAAIAAVLSDMDAELAALEQRRDKTRALKQGMMQELLTGRTRLV